MIIGNLLSAYFEAPYLIPLLHCVLTAAGVKAWMAHSAQSQDLSSPDTQSVKNLAQRVADLGRLGVADAVAQERHGAEEALAAHEDRIRAMANAILLLGVCATLVGVFKATSERTEATTIAETLKHIAEPFAYTAIGALWAVLLLWLQSNASKLRASAITKLCHAIDEAWAEGYREYQDLSHEGLAAALLPVMEGLANGLAGFQSRAFDDFGTAIGGLSGVVTSLEVTLTSAQASAQNQSESTATSAEAVKRLADVLEQMRGVEANYAKIADLGQAFKNDMSGARVAFEHVAGSTAMLVKESAASFQESMKDVHGQLVSLAGQLAAVEQYAAGTREMAERLGTVGDRFDRLFADYTVAREEHSRLMANVAAEAIATAAAASTELFRQSIAGLGAQRGGAARPDQSLLAAIEQLGQRERERSRNFMAVLAVTAIIAALSIGSAFVVRTPSAVSQSAVNGGPGHAAVEEAAQPAEPPVQQVIAAVAPDTRTQLQFPSWHNDVTICANLARTAVACIYSCTAPKQTCSPTVDMPIAPTPTDGPVAFAAATALHPGKGKAQESSADSTAAGQERMFRACLHGLTQLRSPQRAEAAVKVEACLGLGAGAIKPASNQ